MAKSEISECLQKCELFSRLNKQEVENIAGLGRLETYQAGENILSQGDFGENLYIIAESDTPETFVERVDAALYEAKKNGRNRVEMALD